MRVSISEIPAYSSNPLRENPWLISHSGKHWFFHGRRGELGFRNLLISPEPAAGDCWGPETGHPLLAGLRLRRLRGSHGRGPHHGGLRASALGLSGGALAGD